MRLLLDTHVWLWTLVEPGRLGPESRALLEDPGTEIWLSPISVWEALLLVERGRIAVDGSPDSWVDALVRATPRREAALTHDVVLASRQVKLSHQDPADRFLAGTARVMDLPLLTADRHLLAGTGFPVLAIR